MSAIMLLLILEGWFNILEPPPPLYILWFASPNPSPYRRTYSTTSFKLTHYLLGQSFFSFQYAKALMYIVQPVFALQLLLIY